MASITSLAPVLQHLLTDVAEEAARAHGCVRRERAFSGASLVRTLVLGFLAHPDATLTQLRHTAASQDVAISAQGLAQRYTPALAATLETVLAAAVQQVVAGERVALPLLERFTHVWVLDTTVVSLPAELAERWPSCGGTASPAALKAAIELDLVTGALAGPLVAPGRAADRTSPLLARARAAGSLTLRDQGFFRLEQLAAETAAGGWWLTRPMSNVIVRTSDGRVWTQAALLDQQYRDQVELPVRLGTKAHLPARLIAQRVPRRIARQRRKQLRRQAQTKGQTVSAERLALAAWTVLITNVPADRLSLDEALALMRARWQIEQLIDLWKTHGGLDRSRSAQPWRIVGEVYAKLIALVVQHWLLVQGDWAAPNHSLVKAAAAVRAWVGGLGVSLDRRADLCWSLARIGDILRQAGRLNTRKRCPNTCQRLLDPVGTRLT
jgi:hypothetical protein